MSVPLTLQTSIDAREENEDDKKSESARVSRIVEWANFKADQIWTTENGLERLLKFK